MYYSEADNYKEQEVPQLDLKHYCTYLFKVKIISYIQF